MYFPHVVLHRNIDTARVIYRIVKKGWRGLICGEDQKKKDEDRKKQKEEASKKKKTKRDGGKGSKDGNELNNG